MLRIGVWGGGAIGLLWAGRLCRLFPETWVITRSREQRDLLRSQGLIWTDQQGKSLQVHPHVEWSGGNHLPAFDVIFLTVKQTVVAEVLPLLSALSPSPDIWLWQNGLGVEDRTGSMRLVRVVTSEGALRLGPGQVQHTGTGSTYIGPVCREEMPGNSARLVRKLAAAGMPVSFDPDIDRRVWVKLAVNCVINPLAALWNIPNGRLSKQAGFTRWMEGLLEEVVQVAAAEGWIFSKKELTDQIETVCRLTASNRSSMLQDLSRGKRTEVDFINGAVADRGERHGIPTPLNRRLIGLIHQAEKERKLL
ncbi:MAG: 2-dehydropantoate 2-reductase [Firmicutes bacterium]|uniref:2-dehydropantoate 2-reductase n=1 Tax=Melghirimyces thermohalophilus TaxID=1236220 RepID=A0A1G6HQT7_9BACL|nr:2-dehydropantoate 2-reductase [Melghirimyces thermohalophilus]MDA8352164.1 2-dehydropantoate 2-reductase [Bacillota bacterium]SDB96518.1 2-dehydropantoate 2-reductase [Melghirimyces thermohalophilus]